MEKSENNKIEKGFPAPLFRDPIFDGASDPTVIWNRNEQCYYMFIPRGALHRYKLDFHQSMEVRLEWQRQR
ncbi:MAG: hypothetical protein ACLR5J_11615 [Lachnospiraceae bacterium]